MENTISEALFLKLRVGFVFFIFKVAKSITTATDCSRMKAYLTAIGVSACFAAVSWASHGTHTENSDPLYGGGETVVDFVPSKQERNQQGVFVFIVLGVASLVGTHSGLKARANKSCL